MQPALACCCRRRARAIQIPFYYLAAICFNRIRGMREQAGGWVDMGKRAAIRPVDWDGGRVVWINQRNIPWKEEWRRSSSVEELARAIETLEIRGAPAIGVAAGFALTLAVWGARGGAQGAMKALRRGAGRIRSTRPTAVNLFWAVQRMLDRAERMHDEGATLAGLKEGMLEEARAIQREDIEANMAIGRYGNSLVRDGDVILTHCNAGALATAGYGTSYGVIRAAWESGKDIRVIATQTAPLYQGARLTIWELTRDGIPATLITDSMAAYAMGNEGVTKVMVGADRILLNGSVANKIGTLGLAVIAKHVGIPFYVAAPLSTVDPKSRSIPIESRAPEEVRTFLGKVRMTVEDVPVLNPAFDVTPPRLVSAIITERGIARKPYERSLGNIIGARGGKG